MKRTFFEQIISFLSWMCCLFSLIMTLIMILVSLSGEKNGKEVFGFQLLIVASDSMSQPSSSENEPIFFDAGDLIIIRRVEDFEALKEGDVITFFSYNPESYGKTVTHKIREIRYDRAGSIVGFITYGINTNVNDTVLVKPENVMGKYLFKIADAGTLFSFLKTPRGYFTSILIPAVLLILFFGIQVGKALGK